MDILLDLKEIKGNVTGGIEWGVQARTRTRCAYRLFSGNRWEIAIQALVLWALSYGFEFWQKAYNFVSWDDWIREREGRVNLWQKK